MRGSLAANLLDSLRTRDQRVSAAARAVLVILVAVACLGATAPANAEERFPVTELVFNRIFATRAADQDNVYCPLAGGFLLGMTSPDAEALMSNWLATHRGASVRAAGRMQFSRPKAGRPTGYSVSVWIDDGAESLNVFLIRKGAYPGGVMIDAVERFSRSPSETSPAEEKGEPPQRLVSDAEYAAFMERIWTAHKQAKADKIGIWSDRYISDREALGIE